METFWLFTLLSNIGIGHFRHTCAIGEDTLIGVHGSVNGVCTLLFVVLRRFFVGVEFILSSFLVLLIGSVIGTS